MKKTERENMCEVLGYSVNTIIFLLLVSVLFGVKMHNFIACAFLGRLIHSFIRKKCGVNKDL